MRRLTPSLALLGLVLLGCAGKDDTSKPASPADDQAVTSPHQATVEVEGMH
jgi:hypothetical protein